MRIRPALFIALALTSSLFLSSCGSTPKKIVVSTPKAPPVNLFTALPGGNGPIVVVKVDDTPAAHPQIGLESADIVYIEQVEGGLTRIAAIFSNPLTLPDLVGPVRSARISDIDIFAQYGRIGFAFSGAQKLLYPKIAAANLENISADHEPASIYSRAVNRQEPTNEILHLKSLLFKSLDIEKRKIAMPKDPGWFFGAAPVGSRPIISASFTWPASHYAAKWSTSQKRWLLTYQGAPDTAESGVQLGCENLIIQKVTITPSIYHDKVGGITPFSQTVGSGTAYLLRSGGATPIFWNRATPDSVTSWTTKEGVPAKFTPGKIWIALVAQDPLFVEAPLASAPPTTKK